MKKIVAFGDSFTNYTWSNEFIKSTDPDIDTDKFWVNEVARNLNLEILNYGSAGSSHTYAFHKFCEYYQSQDYDPEDVIIFQTSEMHSRSYTLDMPPHLGVSVSQKDNPGYHKLEKKWIKNNVESYFWYMSHTTHAGLNFDLIQMLSFFQIWTEKNKTNKFIFLRGFLNYDPPIEKLNSIIQPTSNFFPIISENNSLFKISSQEFANEELMHIALQKIDKRINHLTEENRKILAQIILDMLATNSIEPFNKTKFIENIYNNYEDAQHLSNRKLFL